MDNYAIWYRGDYRLLLTYVHCEHTLSGPINYLYRKYGMRQVRPMSTFIEGGNEDQRDLNAKADFLITKLNTDFATSAQSLQAV